MSNIDCKISDAEWLIMKNQKTIGDTDRPLLVFCNCSLNLIGLRGRLVLLISLI
ncbi:MAG: hypothetical protein ABFC94_00925 [Syntrophomonas sp.]